MINDALDDDQMLSKQYSFPNHQRRRLVGERRIILTLPQPANSAMLHVPLARVLDVEDLIVQRIRLRATDIVGDHLIQGRSENQRRRGANKGTEAKQRTSHTILENEIVR